MLSRIRTYMGNCSPAHIVCVALAVRLAWYLLILLTNAGGFWLYDSNEYWNIAYNLHEYGVMSRDADLPLIPDYFRTPLYPLFIYPTLWFDDSGNTIPLLQIAADSITCLLVFRIVLQLGARRTYANAAAWLYALHIPAIVMTNYVLSESIFALLLCLFASVSIGFMQQPHLKTAVWAGIIGGLCVMCKPIAFALVFPAGLFFLMCVKFKPAQLKYVFIFVLLFYAVQIPWMQRNKNIYGRYFNSVLGEHLLLGYHTSHVYAKAKGIDFNYAQDILRDSFVVNLPFNPYEHPYEYAKIIARESYRILLRNKGIFLQEHLKECAKFFVQPMNGYIKHQLGAKHNYTSIVAGIFLVIQLLVSAFIVLGIGYMAVRWLIRRHKPGMPYAFMLVTVFIFCQFNTMPYTDGRMRFPFDGILLAMSFYALYTWRNRRHIAPVK